MNKYRNKFEEKTGNGLTQKGIQFGYETEKLDYVLTGRYIPDFIITRKDGHKIYIESKGGGRSFDAGARRKMVAVRGQHPDKDIRLLFYADGLFGPKRKDGSRMSQMQWAEKNGFTAAVKDVPEEWLL